MDDFRIRGQQRIINFDAKPPKIPTKSHLNVQKKWGTHYFSLIYIQLWIEIDLKIYRSPYKGKTLEVSQELLLRLQIVCKKNSEARSCLPIVRSCLADEHVSIHKVNATKTERYWKILQKINSFTQKGSLRWRYCLVQEIRGLTNIREGSPFIIGP